MQTTFCFIFIKEMKALHVALSKCQVECDEKHVCVPDLAWLSVLKNGTIKVDRRPAQGTDMHLYVGASKHAPSAPLQG